MLMAVVGEEAKGDVAGRRWFSAGVASGGEDALVLVRRGWCELAIQVVDGVGGSVWVYVLICRKFGSFDVLF